MAHKAFKNSAPLSYRGTNINAATMSSSGPSRSTGRSRTIYDGKHLLNNSNYIIQYIYDLWQRTEAKDRRRRVFFHWSYILVQDREGNLADLRMPRIRSYDSIYSFLAERNCFDLILITCLCKHRWKGIQENGMEIPMNNRLRIHLKQSILTSLQARYTTLPPQQKNTLSTAIRNKITIYYFIAS